MTFRRTEAADLDGVMEIVRQAQALSLIHICTSSAGSASRRAAGARSWAFC